MNIKILATLILSLVCTFAYAAEGSITIISPTKDAMFSSKNKVPVKYEAVLGPNGNHLHLYVDGKRVDILRQIKGTAELDPLAPGRHHICLTVNTVTHAPTGVETCVDVTAQ
jgi:hypothetical protein